MSDKSKISTTQLYFILLQTQLGIGIITMQQLVIRNAGKSAWIAVLLGGLCAQLMIFIIWGALKKFPNLSSSDAIAKLVGRGFGKLIGFIYAVFFFVLVVISLYWMSDVMNFWILPKTPFWLIVFIGALLLLYTSRNDLRSHASMLSVSTILLPVFVVFFCYAFRDADVRYLMPVATNLNGNGMFYGIIVTIYMLLGFETLLFYMGETKSDNPREALKAASYANLTATLFYTFLMIVTLISYSPSEIELFNQPIVNLARSFRIGVSDHYELVFLAMWLWQVFGTMMSYSFLLTRRVQHIFSNRISLSKVVYFTIASIFFVTLGINSTIKIAQFQTFALWWGLIAVIAIPFLLFIISLFKKGEAEPK